MPELPEVETVCRGLAPVLAGQVIARAVMRRKDLRKPFPGGLRTLIESAKVVQITRRAKYIRIHLDNGYVLLIHLGMSGRLVCYPCDYKPQTHDHFILHMQDGRQIVLNDPRRFGLVDIAGAAALEDHPLFAHLGPEPLSGGFSAPVLAASLKGRKAAIKQVIMDQRVVVGVGNIYASEALFMAGISPVRPAGALTADQVERLTAAIRQVLQKAIAAGGSTLRDYRQAHGELGYFQHNFSVYDREGLACVTCTGKRPVMRIIQGGRSTFYCPSCQR